MRCRRSRTLLSPLLDERLASEEEDALRAHLSDCPACSEMLTDMRAARDAIALLPVAEVPAGLAERAARAALTADGDAVTRSFAARLIPVAWPTLAAAAVGVALMLALSNASVPEEADAPDAVVESLLDLEPLPEALDLLGRDE